MLLGSAMKMQMQDRYAGVQVVGLILVVGPSTSLRPTS